MTNEDIQYYENGVIKFKNVENFLTAEEFEKKLNDVISHIASEMNSECPSPWDSDNITRVARLLFSRVDPKELCKLPMMENFPSELIVKSTGDARPIDSTDFDVTAFKYDASRILKNVVNDEISDHPKEIAVVIALSKDARLTTNLGDGDYQKPLVYTSHYHNNDNCWNASKYLCWSMINGLIDTAINRHWESSSVLYAVSAMLAHYHSEDIISHEDGVSIINAMDIIEDSRLMAFDSKPIGSEEDVPYTKLNVVYNIDSDFSIKKYGKAIALSYHGFKPIDVYLNNASIVIRTAIEALIDEHYTTDKIMETLSSLKENLSSIIETLLHDYDAMVSSEISSNFNNHINANIGDVEIAEEKSNAGVKKFVCVPMQIVLDDTFSSLCGSDNANLILDLIFHVYAPDTNESKTDSDNDMISSNIVVNHKNWYYVCTNDNILPGATNMIGDVTLESTNFNPDKYVVNTFDNLINFNEDANREGQLNMPENNESIDNSFPNENMMNNEINNNPSNMCGNEGYPFMTGTGICYNLKIGARHSDCGNQQKKFSMLFSLPDRKDDICMCIIDMKCIKSDLCDDSAYNFRAVVNTHNFPMVNLLTNEIDPFSMYSYAGLLARFNFANHGLKVKYSAMDIHRSPFNNEGFVMNLTISDGNANSNAFENRAHIISITKDVIIEHLKQLVLADYVATCRCAALYSFMDNIHSMILTDIASGGNNNYKSTYEKYFKEAYYDISMDGSEDIL